MKPHANSHENDEEHHLYEIFDVERANLLIFNINNLRQVSNLTQVINANIGLKRVFRRNSYGRKPDILVVK